MKERKTSQKAAPKRVSLPMADLMPVGETVVIYGDRRMTVQGCRKILVYTPVEIRLQLKQRRICVYGTDLGCSSFSGGCTTVTGVIRAVEFHNAGKGEGMK